MRIIYSATRHLVVSPLAFRSDRAMFERHKLEKAEGKSYDEKDVCFYNLRFTWKMLTTASRCRTV